MAAAVLCNSRLILMVSNSSRVQRVYQANERLPFSSCHSSKSSRPVMLYPRAAMWLMSLFMH